MKSGARNARGVNIYIFSEDAGVDAVLLLTLVKDEFFEEVVEVSITQNDKVFLQVYLYLCYSFNILRMTDVKIRDSNVCKISVKLFAHFMQTQL